MQSGAPSSRCASGQTRKDRCSGKCRQSRRNDANQNPHTAARIAQAQRREDHEKPLLLLAWPTDAFGARHECARWVRAIGGLAARQQLRITRTSRHEWRQGKGQWSSRNARCREEMATGALQFPLSNSGHIGDCVAVRAARVGRWLLRDRPYLIVASCGRRRVCLQLCGREQQRVQLVCRLRQRRERRRSRTAICRGCSGSSSGSSSGRHGRRGRRQRHPLEQSGQVRTSAARGGGAHGRMRRRTTATADGGGSGRAVREQLAVAWLVVWAEAEHS